MTKETNALIATAAPIVFVLLWSTGFIGTKYVLGGAEPLTYLTVRMIIAASIMGVIVLLTRPVWPEPTTIASKRSGLLLI